MKQNKQQWTRDKQHSSKCKKEIKHDKFFKIHDSILESHIPYGLMTNKSPRIIINKWYHRFKDNCILLSLKNEIDDKKIKKYFMNWKNMAKMSELGVNKNTSTLILSEL